MKGKPTYDDQPYYEIILDELKSIILEKGEISDADFDRLDINDELPCINDGFDSRTVILANMELTKSEVDKSDAKKATAAAVVIKLQLAKDKKLQSMRMNCAQQSLMLIHQLMELRLRLHQL